MSSLAGRWLVTSLFLVVACAETPAPATPSAASGGSSSAPKAAVGGDEDAHGCIESAGYSWCAKEKDCVRPWELASSKSLGEGKDAFDHYCGN